MMKGVEKLRAATATYATDPARWAAVTRRDPLADGHFFYGVTSTGVYCRPTCASRLPLRKNVQFFSSATEARKAGLRPCRRCHPDDETPVAESARKIALACRLLEQAEDSLSLACLAEKVGLSTWHFHRLFTRILGISPKRYAQAVRDERLRHELASRDTVTEALYEAGYSSSSRFYSRAMKMLGMRPTKYKAGGVGETLSWGLGKSSLGWVLVAASERGVCAILLGENAQGLTVELRRRFPSAQLKEGNGDFRELVARAVQAVEEPGAAIHLPLDVRGTAFQQRVWEALCQIPPGSTSSYTDVAAKIGSPSAVRAVAQACASNNIAVLIPCHRVVRADGGLSGYRWGVERKSELLRRESRKAANSKPSSPDTR